MGKQTQRKKMGKIGYHIATLTGTCENCILRIDFNHILGKKLSKYFKNEKVCNWDNILNFTFTVKYKRFKEQTRQHDKKKKTLHPLPLPKKTSKEQPI